MKQLFLHIGMHKTGTSAIQAFLNRSSKELKSKGFLYPNSYRDNNISSSMHVGHHRLAWATINRYASKYDETISDEPWKLLNREIKEKQSEKVVISSEFFWPADQIEIDKISEHLSDYDVKILLYLRNSLGLAVSLYKQDVKTGICSSNFREYTKSKLWVHDYDAIIRKWNNSFEKKNIQLKIYDKVKSNLIEDFCNTIKYKNNSIINEKIVQNKSPSNNLIKILLFLNFMESKTKNYLNIPFNRIRRNILMRRIPGKYIANISERILNADLLSDGDIFWLKDKVSADNELFINKWIKDDDKSYFKF